MSPTNLEIVREALGATMAGSAGVPDEAALNRLFDREHEFVSSLTGVEGRSYRALDGYVRYRKDMEDAWGAWRMDVEELVDAGGDTVVAIGQLQARGRASGAELDLRVGIVFTLRDGRIRRTHTYFDPADAFEAAGLPRPSSAPDPESR
jgi:ketosteroid isomerase-like protein